MLLASSGGPVEKVYLWDGSVWSPLGADTAGTVRSMAQAPTEANALYLGGEFNDIAGVPSEGIARYGCPPCPADFNHDGTLNTRDFIAFLAAWAAGDARADFNEDGDIDTQDFTAYLNAWTAGC